MPLERAPTESPVQSALERSRRAVLARIDAACDASGRPPGAARLLPVTKSVGAEVALALSALGETDLAENRIDALEAKAERFADAGREVSWHFVGPLQRNKARRVARVADVVHSVSNAKLLDTLARVAEEEGRTLGVYLEVHLSGEEEKHGFAPKEVADAVRAAGAASALRLLGLMTMAPRPDPDDALGHAARRTFDACARLADELVAAQPDAFVDRRARLSMGMTGDLEAAVAAGSTCVRVGRALFADIPEASA